MSKIKISEVTALTTNGDLALTPNGTGTVKVKNEDTHAALQLNSSGNSSKVKIKSPPSSANQNYTLVLPDNNIEANKYLSVKSVTGSGSTAVGQLEYATVTVPSLNLDAGNIDTTSGTVPSAQLPSPLPATTGLGYQFVSKSTSVVDPNTGVPPSSMSFTGLEDDATYRFKTNKFYFHNFNSDFLNIRFLDSNGSEIQAGYDYNNFYSYRTSPSYYHTSSGSSRHRIHFYGQNQYYTIQFIAQLNTKDGCDYLTLDAAQPYTGYGVRSYNIVNLQKNYQQRIHGIKFYTEYGTQFEPGAEIAMYKYQEA